MAIVTLRGPRREKWNIRLFSQATPLRFTKAQLAAFPENRNSFINIPRDAVIEIIRIAPAAVMRSGTRGIITWRSELGPWGFDVDAWVDAIEQVTGRP